jgi:hypothetical protein
MTDIINTSLTENASDRYIRIRREQQARNRQRINTLRFLLQHADYRNEQFRLHDGVIEALVEAAKQLEPWTLG